MDRTAQLELERLFHKNQVMPRLRSEFSVPEIVEHCEAKEIPLSFALDLLAQMALHKRTTLETLVGLLHRHFEDETNPFQACTDALTEALIAGLVEWEPTSRQFVVRIDVTQDVREELDRLQYPLPMVIEPMEVRDNRDTGYLTHHDSIILKGGNHHDGDVCLDHINRVNRVPLKLNPDIARLMRNRWKGLDRQKPTETFTEFQQRQKAFAKYDRTSKEVIEHLVMTTEQFWLTHRYDKRGRCYAQGYHVNTQGNDWNKAMIEFAETEIVEMALPQPQQEILLCA